MPLEQPNRLESMLVNANLYWREIFSDKDWQKTVLRYPLIRVLSWYYLGFAGFCGLNSLTLKDLSITLNNHGRHGLFSFLSSLPISVLRNLELEANKIYDRANRLYKTALLARYYFQHFVSPYVDS